MIAIKTNSLSLSPNNFNRKTKVNRTYQGRSICLETKKGDQIYVWSYIYLYALAPTQSINSGTSIWDMSDISI
jgi:hypothetical protein